MTSLSKRVTFRITEDEYNKFQENVRHSGYNQSEFFRKIVLASKNKIVNKLIPIYFPVLDFLGSYILTKAN